jgi:hypothetical protein
MYKTLETLDLTPAQREVLDFLTLQAGRYEKVRNVNKYDLFKLQHLAQIKTGENFDKLVDEMV